MRHHNLSAKYQRLLTLLNGFEYKINELSAFRISSNYQYSKIIETSQLCILEKHLEIELIDLSQMFDVPRRSAIILCSMFFNSYSQKGFVSKIVSEEDLALSVCLDYPVILDLKDAISELGNKNIITVKLLKDSTKKSFALTETFLRKLTN